MSPVPLSNFHSIFCNGEEVRCENLPVLFPSTEPPTSSLPLSCTCPCQNVEVLMALCVPTSLLSPVTLQTAGQLLCCNWDSSNVHPMASRLTISELGVPTQSKGAKGRINDCLQELFRTHWHSRRKHVRQLRSRKNINIPLFIHRLFVYSSNTKVHETEQSILCLT